MFETYARPEEGEATQLAAFGRDQAGDRGASPRQTTPDAVLGSLGFTVDEIVTLKQSAVVG
jgi:hypothetical protein